MAETTRGVWGIDIGQAGLKAIRLKYAEAAGQVLAVAFDYVPHAKILSQPDAVPDELIGQALQTFLSRNDVKGDMVCISVPGQSALARFIQLPPVEQSKVADIVKYEAKQQIPFALEEVIWGWQVLGAGSQEGGFLLEAEVGLFAMKREQVMQQLRPYLNSKVEVELVQIAPLGLYNFLTYDQLGIRPGDEKQAAEGYTILLDMGADNTMLLVSNGGKIWIRNVPIGGNHFTRALTKEMKLTFAKAEHLKCNATKSPDPRAVFQALRPVFNDYAAEIQRSIGYFSSVNRDAKITKLIGLGNGFKLAGLQKFLQQNLQYEVEKVETFQGLVGDTVLHAPLFEENLLSFAVPYGMALQGLGLTRIHTTLLPQEIATARKIRKKKPWAALTAASLLFGLAGSAIGYGMVYNSVAKERFGAAEDKAAALTTEISGHKSAYGAEEAKYTKTTEDGNKLVAALDTREQWLEVYKAINESLPRDVGDAKDESDPAKKNRIKILSISSKKLPDAKTWFDGFVGPLESVKEWMTIDDKTTEPTGAAYLFTLHGVHYHQGDTLQMQRVQYVKNTLLKNLQSWRVHQDGSEPFPVGQLGISHATITHSEMDKVPHDPDMNRRFPNRFGGPMAGGLARFGAGDPGRGRGPLAAARPPGLPGAFAPRGAGAGDPKGARGFGAAPGFRGGAIPDLDDPNVNAPDANTPLRMIERTRFTVEFLWYPTLKDKREAESPEEKKKREAAGGAAPGEAPAAVPGAPTPDAPPTQAPPTQVPPTQTPPTQAPQPGTTPPGAQPNPASPAPGSPAPASPAPASPAPAGTPPAGAVPGPATEPAAPGQNGAAPATPPATPPAAGATPPN